MPLDCGATVVKYVLCLFNFALFVSISFFGNACDVTGMRSFKYGCLGAVGRSRRFRYWNLVSRRPDFFSHFDQIYSSRKCAGKNTFLLRHRQMRLSHLSTIPRMINIICLVVLQNLVQPAVITQSAYLLIAAGAFIFIVSFLGYCGAVKESRVLLGLVGISLL
jgi:hypothetical protein